MAEVAGFTVVLTTRAALTHRRRAPTPAAAAPAASRGEGGGRGEGEAAGVVPAGRRTTAPVAFPIIRIPSRTTMRMVRAVWTTGSRWCYRQSRREAAACQRMTPRCRRGRGCPAGQEWRRHCRRWSAASRPVTASTHLTSTATTMAMITTTTRTAIRKASAPHTVIDRLQCPPRRSSEEQQHQLLGMDGATTTTTITTGMGAIPSPACQ